MTNGVPVPTPEGSKIGRGSRSSDSQLSQLGCLPISVGLLRFGNYSSFHISSRSDFYLFYEKNYKTTIQKYAFQIFSFSSNSLCLIKYIVTLQ